jgi:hypothetical protein
MTFVFICYSVCLVALTSDKISEIPKGDSFSREDVSYI